MTTWPVKGFRGQVVEQAPLAPRTTWRIGGPARWLARPADAADLGRLVQGRPREIPMMVLGGGSNLLLPDEGFPGIVVSLAPALTAATLGEETAATVRLVAGGGLSSRGLAHFARRHGLNGVAFLAGIPGSVGGAVVMNAGAYGGEIAQVLEAVEVMDEDGVRRVLSAGEAGLSYRASRIAPGWIVLAAHLRLTRGDATAIRQRMQTLNRQRAASQPLEHPSAGSTFKNPPAGPKAWQLIADAALRGRAVGGAQVSEKHCNFLINRDGASADDMRRLMDLVRQTVFRSSGIVLEPEVKVVGSDGTPWRGMAGYERT